MGTTFFSVKRDLTYGDRWSKNLPISRPRIWLSGSAINNANASSALKAGRFARKTGGAIPKTSRASQNKGEYRHMTLASIQQTIARIGPKTQGKDISYQCL